MKKLGFMAAILALVLIFGAFATALVGCKTDSEQAYTVWTATMTNSEWSAAYGGGATLNDGTYTRAEVADSDWDMYKTMLPDS